MFHVQSMYRGLTIVGDLANACKEYRESKQMFAQLSGAEKAPKVCCLRKFSLYIFCHAKLVAGCIAQGADSHLHNEPPEEIHTEPSKPSALLTIQACQIS